MLLVNGSNFKGNGRGELIHVFPGDRRSWSAIIGSSYIPPNTPCAAVCLDCSYKMHPTYTFLWRGPQSTHQSASPFSKPLHSYARVNCPAIWCFQVCIWWVYDRVFWGFATYQIIYQYKFMKDVYLYISTERLMQYSVNAWLELVDNMIVWYALQNLFGLPNLAQLMTIHQCTCILHDVILIKRLLCTCFMKLF